MGKRILLVGATGLVGQGVLAALLQAPDIDAVSLLVRRPIRAAGRSCSRCWRRVSPARRWRSSTCVRTMPACTAPARCRWA